MLRDVTVVAPGRSLGRSRRASLASLVVDPELVESAIRDGRESGYDDGYDSGYADGLAEARARTEISPTD